MSIESDNEQFLKEPKDPQPVPRAFSDREHAMELLKRSAEITRLTRISDGMTVDDMRPTDKTLNTQIIDIIPEIPVVSEKLP